MMLRSMFFGCLVLYCSQRAGMLISSLLSNSSDESTEIAAFNDLLTSNEMEIGEIMTNAADEKSLESLKGPSVRMTQNFEQPSTDSKIIKAQAKLIRENSEWNIDSILAQIDEATIRYDQTFEKLRKINETIHSFWNGIESVLSKVDKRLEWINESLVDKSEQFNRVYQIFHQIAYLLGAMIIAAFLQVPSTTRVAMIGIILLNFMKILRRGTEGYLDFTSMTLLICLIAALNLFMRYSRDEVENTTKNKTSNRKQQFGTIFGDGSSSSVELPKENPKDHSLKENLIPLEVNTKNENSDRKQQSGTSLGDRNSSSVELPKEKPKDLSLKENLIPLEDITKNENSDWKEEPVGSLNDRISCSETVVPKNPAISSEIKKLSIVENTKSMNSECPMKETDESFVDTKQITKIYNVNVNEDKRSDAKNSISSAQPEYKSAVSLPRCAPILSTPITFQEMSYFRFGGSSRPRSSGLCGAMTQKGTPCRNKPSYGGSTCWRH